MAGIDQDNFSSISWHSGQDAGGAGSSSGPARADEAAGAGGSASNGARTAPDVDVAALETGGFGSEILECTVSAPIKEGDGTKDAFISYLITTNSTFPSFQKSNTTVRRRFTDFVFLYKALAKDYPASAVPPLPDKQRMEYVRGDRFGSDFTARRGHSLQRFLSRLSLHPVLRRAPILHTFLESAEWNATMRTRSARTSLQADAGSGGVFDSFTDTFINAFTKVHRPDKRFIEVKERSDKLDEDLGHIEKVVARVARREADLETDLKDLAEQFHKLVTLEPGVETAVHGFAASVEDTAAGQKRLRDVTDQDYLGSLRDMQAYSAALKNLLKAREQKQLDYEQLTEYLSKSTADRDQVIAQGGGPGGSQGGFGAASSYGATSGVMGGAGSFLRSKLEDARGVDHEQSRRERQRKLEMRVEELTVEVERAKKTSDMFDDEVVKEVADFERIKRVEMKKQLGGLCDAHVAFHAEVAAIWERYVLEMEKEGVVAP